MLALCKRRLRRVHAAASAPVDARSLAVLRIGMGVVGLASAVRIAAYGWIDTLYAGPSHRFTYLGFGWVPQPGPAEMAALVGALGCASLALALGWRTRWAALGVVVSLGWIELIDVTTYLNHYWFLTLVGLLAAAAPVGAAWSLDGRRRGPRPIPMGWVWLFRFQVAVVYVFAGLAKLQGDWLVRALPLRLWLPARADLPLAGPLLDEPATAHVLSLAGTAFDLTIVPLLLWSRTRRFAWPVLVAFHVVTWTLFPIGVFPWLMIVASTVFFDPAWPAALRDRVTRGEHPTGPPPPAPPPGPGRPGRWGPAVRWVAVAAWVGVQVALPLRHLAYPGDARWTGQGYRFAWNVLLTEKAGVVSFLVHEPATGRRWVADPTTLYTPTQMRAMAAEPDLIHQAARAIADRERRRGHRVEVRVDAWVSLNGGPARRLVDPTVDLAGIARDPWSDPWILDPG